MALREQMPCILAAALRACFLVRTCCLPIVFPPGDGELPEVGPWLLNAALGKLFSEFLIPHTCCDVPSNLFSLLSLQWQLRKGTLPLPQACGGSHEGGGHALCYDKASLNGLWPLPSGFLSKAWNAVVPGSV